MVGGGEDETDRESSMETNKRASGNLLYDAGNSIKPGLCDNLEVWDGMGGRFKREGTYVYLWLIHVDVWQKTTQYCKVIILQVKRN